MAKRQPKTEQDIRIQRQLSNPQYKTATCDLVSAGTVANNWHEEGYDLAWSFAVVATIPDPTPADPDHKREVQAIYLIGRKRAV